MRRTWRCRPALWALPVLAGLAAGADPAAGQVAGPVERVDPPRVPGLVAPGVEAAPSARGAVPAPGAAAPGAVALAEVSRNSDVLVIPALFSDSPEPWLAADLVEEILFGDGSPAPPLQGENFVDFWEEVSRGRISPAGEVVEWVRTDVTLLEASGSVNGHGQWGPRRVDYMVQAVRRADPAVDFRLFDNDGPDGIPDSGDDDGFIDVLVIEYLEVAGSCGGPAIWPHFSSLFEAEGVPGVPTEDIGADGTPIRAFRYLTQSITDCSGEEPQGPNVIAHEYGHRLGLPDWYQRIEGIEPEKRHWNIGCFGLMGAGSWGCGSGGRVGGFGPVHLSGYSKVLLGWMEEVTVPPVVEQEFFLEPAQTTGDALRIPLGGPESLYLEYRPRIGFDEWLPAGGVLVYHVDPDWGDRTVPAGFPPAKPLALVEADGDHALRKVARLGGDRGVAGDVFGIGGRTGPYSSAPGPVRLHRSDGSPVPVTLHSVRVEEGVAAVVLSTHPEPHLVDVRPGSGLRALDEGELVRFRLAGGAAPYVVTDAGGGLPATFVAEVADLEGALVGTPLAVGTVELTVRIEDALGTRVERTVTLEVADADIPLADLVDALVSTDPGTVGSYLDGQGNRNGGADVGDLRAWLRRNGG